MSDFRAHAHTVRRTPPHSVRMLAAWRDNRAGNTDIYAQAIYEDGTVGWTANGVAICTNGSVQTLPTMCADGSGGAYIAWSDSRGSAPQVYVQHIDSAGAVQWTANGVLLSAESVGASITAVRVVSNHDGTCVVAWGVNAGGLYAVRAQKLTALGGVSWTANGVSCAGGTGGNPGLCDLLNDSGGIWLAHVATEAYVQRLTAAGAVASGFASYGVDLTGASGTGTQDECQLASDGEGGVFAVWVDTRSSSRALYCQRVNPDASVEFSAGGVSVLSGGLAASGYSLAKLRVIADGAGGVYLAASGAGTEYTSTDIRAQRVDSAGAAQWGAAGLTVCGTTDAQTYPRLALGASRSLWLAWQDSRTGTADVYCQRVSADGVAQFADNGVAVCSATGAQSFADANTCACTDDASGLMVAWSDNRSGTTDVYAQRMSGAGSPYWTANGLAVCAATGAQDMVTGVAP